MIDETEIDRVAILTKMFNDVDLQVAKIIVEQIVNRNLTMKDFYAKVCEEDSKLHDQKRNSGKMNEYWDTIKFIFKELDSKKC